MVIIHSVPPVSNYSSEVIKTKSYLPCEQLLSMNINAITLLVLAVILSLSGCDSGGSVMFARNSCSSSSSKGGGHCNGRFGKLKGTYGQDMSINRNTHSIRVKINASVENGRIRVYLKDPEEKETGMTLSPGQSGQLSGTAAGWSDHFVVYFQALDGEAKDIKYEVTFSY